MVKSKKKKDDLDDSSSSSKDTEMSNPTSWKAIIKRFKFDRDAFPTLTSADIWNEYQEDLVLEAKRQFCNDAFNLDINNPVLTLNGEDLKVYQRRNFDLYCVLIKKISDTEIEPKQLDAHKKDHDARAIFASLIKHHVNKWDSSHTIFCSQWNKL